MKYSIVMPVLLREDSHKATVEACIASIKANSEDYELIIVDDGSTSLTGFLRDAADVYVRHKTNKGIAPSWNDGLSVARGEFVVIINDDIVVPTPLTPDRSVVDTWLDFMSRVFEKEDCGVVAPNWAGPSQEPFLQEGGNWIINHSFYPGYCFMLKRDRFLERFNEIFVPFNFEDVDYWYRIEKKGLQLYRAPVAIWHREGDVVHKLQYERVNSENHKKFIELHGFDPQPIYYA